MRGSSRGRRRYLGALGSLGAGALGGCSWLGGAGNGADEVTIELVDVLGDRDADTYRPVVDRLAAEHGVDVTLEFTEVPYEDIKRTLQTRVGGGNPPDVAAVDHIWLGEFIDGDALLDLPTLPDAVDVDDYIDPFVECLYDDGTPYGVPVSTDVRGMYWDREAFADAGLDPADPPETWPEFFEAARRLHDPPARYGAGYLVAGGRWLVNLFAAGGDVLADGRPEPQFQEAPGVDAAGFLDRLYNEAAVGPPEPPYADGARFARSFLRGEYAMTVIEGSWLDYFWENMDAADGDMVERFGFAPTPRPEGGSVATVSGGHLWVGFRGTDHPDVVRAFLEVAAGTEFKRHLALDTGRIPVRESLQDDPELWASVAYADQVRELLDHARLRPSRNWPVVARELDPALQRVAFDEEDPETALADAATAVREELQ